MDIASKIESLLFFKAEPVSLKELGALLGVSEHDVSAGLQTLAERLRGRGITLVQTEDTAILATAPEMSEMLQNITKAELEKDLGKAGTETLTIVLYHGPVTRSQVDYIRGVNSTYILRHLLVRGLIEKIPNPKDSRSYLYRPTLDLLAHLGIAKVGDLPEYATVRAEMNAFVTEKDNEQKTAPSS